MSGKPETAFFIHVAVGARGLSGCGKQQGAVLVRDHRILSYGFSRKVIKGEKWEISAIYDALFGVHHENLTGTALYCTQFPSVEDVVLMVCTSVSRLYFLGQIDNPETVNFINALHKASIPLEIVQLQK